MGSTDASANSDLEISRHKLIAPLSFIPNCVLDFLQFKAHLERANPIKHYIHRLAHTLSSNPQESGSDKLFVAIDKPSVHFNKVVCAISQETTFDRLERRFQQRSGGAYRRIDRSPSWQVLPRSDEDFPKDEDPLSHQSDFSCMSFEQFGHLVHTNDHHLLMCAFGAFSAFTDLGQTEEARYVIKLCQLAHRQALQLASHDQNFTSPFPAPDKDYGAQEVLNPFPQWNSTRTKSYVKERETINQERTKLLRHMDLISRLEHDSQENNRQSKRKKRVLVFKVICGIIVSWLFGFI